MRTNRRNLRLALTALMLLVLGFSASGAVSVGAQTTSWWTVWYVDGNNCPGPGSGTRSDPFCKIQDAIYAASAGDTISVAKGIYTECLNMPTDNLIMTVGDLADELVAFDVPQDSEEPKVDANNPTWKVTNTERVSACDNRPGLKKIYVTVLDDKGAPLRGVKVRFETEPSEGIAYDHMNIWGLTDENGYLEWDHLGIPTRYVLYMEDDEAPLIENIRTDLGNEYCKPPGSSWWSGNVPVNRPGIYSYRIKVQKKG
jgi:hypothetical protein